MFKPILRMAALCVALTVLVSAAPPAPANIAGRWQFTVELSLGTGRPVVTIRQDGEKITGTYEGRYGKSPLEGAVKENQVAFTVTVVAEGATVTGSFVGKIDNDRMAGSVEYEGAGDGSWNGVRITEKK